MKFKRMQLVSQGSINRMLQEAMQAWRRKDFQQCFELLERARRLDPANPYPLVQLGSAHGNRYDFAAAESCFEKAVRFASGKAEMLTLAGQVCRDFKNYEMADGYLRRAVAQKDATPETFARLAEICERRRRLADAAELAGRALRLDDNCALARLICGKLDRQAGRLAEAETHLRPLLVNAETAFRVQGGYELAAVLDRQKRYDEAMAALLEAKALVRSQAAAFSDEKKIVRALLGDLRTRFTPEKLLAWRDAAPALQPARRLAFLCGHPRSGTTLLEQVLDSHPDILSVEETNIFPDDAYLPLSRRFPEGTPLLTVLDDTPAATLQQSRQNYFRCAGLLLGSPVAGRLLIDKNPSLTPLLLLIIRIFPEVKLLVALRDPRDVVLSCFMQFFYPVGRTTSSYLSLEETVEEYAELMGTWTTLAPVLKDLSIAVRYEDMVDDLERVARRTLDFLGVPWDERVLRFDEHARQKTVNSPTYADVTRPVFKTAVGRWRNYQKYLEPYLDKLEPFARAWGYE